MSIVLADGDVRPGDAVRVVLPDTQYQALEPV
jgi:MOSC domain-containing protein YiiM